MTTIIFVMVFLTQIYVISVYYPMKFVRRIEHVLLNYPASEYPKLYANQDPVIASANAQKGKVIFRNLSLAIALLGLIILGLNFATVLPIGEGNDVEQHAFFYLLQMLPYILLELSEFKQMSRMRASLEKTNRSAELQPRTLSNYVSPVLVILAGVLHVTWIVFFLFVKGDGDLMNADLWDSKAVFVVGFTTLAQVLFITIAMWHLFGRKFDPYLSDEDRFARTKLILQILLIASFGISIFLSTSLLMGQLGWHQYRFVMISAYLQFAIIFGPGMMLRRHKLEDIDFSVYRVG